MSARYTSWARTQDAVGRAVAAVRGVAPGPGLIRITALLLGVVALLVALAGPLRASPWIVLVVVLLAAPAAMRPDSPWVTVVEVTVVLEWLLSALLYDEARSIVALLATAVLLYAHHTICALAAGLPLSARLAPGVLLGWLTRTGIVLVATVLLAVVALVALPSSGSAAVGLLLGGLLAAIAAAAVIVFQLHARGRR